MSLDDHTNVTPGVDASSSDAPAARGNKKDRRGRPPLVEIAVTVGVALLITLILRLFVLQIATVEGISMEGTLHPSERVVILMFDYWFDEPHRGDIVLCSYPGYEDMFIKRILALPGEMVLIRDGTVYVNGRPLPEPYIDSPATEDFGPTMVEDGCYFVLGDNRPNSGDSRLASVGSLPRENINGRAVLLLNTLERIERMQQ